MSQLIAETGNTTDSSTKYSMMAAEAAFAGDAITFQLAANAELVAKLAAELRKADPRLLVTVARGSSDNAATFAKSLIEALLGIPVVSQPPSIGSLYHASSRHLSGIPVLIISQSGQSPDLLESARDARRVGARVISLVNVEDSPLAELSDLVIPLRAGPEHSVAATKSFIASLSAITQLVAHWSDDAAMLDALDDAGGAVRRAWDVDWSHALPLVEQSHNMLILGRGPTLAIAQEAALKLKEVAHLHAEAFSIAEVAHGPMTMVRVGDPVMVFVPSDAARHGARERIHSLAQRGARVIACGTAEDIGSAEIKLVHSGDNHPAISAMAMISSFYRFAESLARLRGEDPDNPPFLKKVTETR